MIYHVLTAKADRREVADAVRDIDHLFATARGWRLDREELDLERGLRRVTALKKVLGLERA